jgi:ribonuclease D
MTISPTNNPFSFSFIESASQAHQAIEQFLSSQYLAIDLEFYWRSSYYPQLCVLQIADQNNSVVIDALSPSIQPELTPLLHKLTQHPLLIFHSGRQDWQIFEQYCGKMPNSVLDIQYAGIYYGLGESPSLSKLTECLLQYEKCNQQQCSDWRERPLSEQQIAYARSDVEYIIHSYHIIKQQLDNKKMQALQQDSEDALLKGKIQPPLEQLGAKIFGYKKLSGRNQLKLQELAKWREQKAQQKDKPARWICPNEALLAFAKDPSSINKKTTTTKPLKSTYKNEIISICTQIETLSPDEINQKLTPNQNKPVIQITELKQQIINNTKKKIEKIISQNPHLSPNIIGKKNLIQFLQSPDKNILLRGWRYYFIGEKLLQLSQQDLEKWTQDEE